MRKKRRHSIISVAQWAGRMGLADDDRSRAIARKVIADGDGPATTRVRRSNALADVGIKFRDHRRWVRRTPWASYLAKEGEQQ
jgi:hypothetical protein